MNSTEESGLRISILRALAGNPRTFKAREVLDIIRGEGERVEEPEFIRVFTELTQAGLVEVAEVPEVDAAQLFRITRRGVEVLKLKEGDSFDERSVEIDILRRLSRRELTKAEIFDCIRAGGHVIDETDFEKLFCRMEERKLIRWVSMKCAEGDTRRFCTTDFGKGYLASILHRTREPDFKTLHSGHVASDIILICLRYSEPMGTKAICRAMRPHSTGFGAREISLMIAALEENGLLAHGKGGYRVTGKARAYLEDRIERLANSDRKRDMRDAIRLLLAELSSLQVLGQKQAAALKGKGGKC